MFRRLIPLLLACYGEEVLLKEITFEGIDFAKVGNFPLLQHCFDAELITFFDNTTLYDDIRFIDQTVAKFAHSDANQSDSVPSTPSTPPDRLYLNVLLVADYSMYHKFSEFYPSSPNSAYFAVQDYLRVIFDQMYSIYYRLIFFKQTRIFLRLAGTLPIIRAPDCPLQRVNDVNDTDVYENVTYVSNDLPHEFYPRKASFAPVDALQSVHAIHDWLEEYEDLLPDYDHVIVFTRRDLLSQTNESATQGMAYVRAMCRGPDSTSVVEDVGGLTTVAIAAHEMAHSLGSFHDGSGNSSHCPGSHNFLMAPHTSGNELSDRFAHSFLLSDCSLEHIEEFLEISRSPRSQHRLPTRRGPRRRVRYSIELNNAGLHSGRPTESVWRLWCQDRTKSRHSTCQTKAFLPVMDGTFCGAGRWCVRGDCVRNEHFMTEECVDVRQDYCQRFSVGAKRRHCVSKHIQKICCRTCEHYIPGSSKPTKDKTKVRKLPMKTEL